MANVINFFDHPTTLRDPELFTGRRELLTRIFSLLKGKQNVSLVGPRRIGKTSLLNCLSHPLIQQDFGFDNEHFLFLRLDLQNRSLKPNIDFLDEVYGVLKTYARKQGFSVNGAVDRGEEMNELLEYFQEHGLHPVLIIDTFDEIIQYGHTPEAHLSFLRSLGTAGNISYVIASVEPLTDILRNISGDGKLFAKPSPFPNIFATLKLNSFTPDEAAEMVDRTSRLGNLPFSSEEVNWVLRLAGTHPFLIQQVATLLFEAKRRQVTEKIDYEQLQEEVQQNVLIHFEEFWSLLKGPQRQAIIADARSLSKKSITQEHWDSRIYPEICRNDLFLMYLQETGHLLLYPPELKSALENFHHPDVLGDNLALVDMLSFLAARIEQQQAATALARGGIIQQVLREALNNIKHDSTHHGLLDYTYFQRKRLKNEFIASRVGISSRQYYRDLPKACEVLWNELLAIDTRETLEVGKQ